MSEVITPTTPAPPPEEQTTTFADLGLGPDTLRAIVELGFTIPTPIQLQTIPFMLAGRDVVAQAPTGTGKTAAYGLPLVDRLDPAILAPQVLVVVPTRELALQVSEALRTFGRFRHLMSVPIYGGQSYERQFSALHRGPQFVVGTPGRLLDHLRRETLRLDQVRAVVLDEADEMLDMGFIEDIEAILATLPAERQSALFSATVPPRIVGLAERFLHNPEQVRVDTSKAIAPLVRQIYYDVPAMAKVDALARILAMEEPTSAIIFVGTRHETDDVAEHLNHIGYPAQAIHGEISQAQRERVMQSFRAGRTTLLVATDVAARGLDIPEVSHVINYDLPMESESYIHRIGRTGRAGREGEALTLVTPREQRRLRFLEHAIHRKLERRRLPNAAEIAAKRREAFRHEVMQVLDAGQLDPFLAIVRDLAGSRDPAEIAAAAFKLAAQAREAQQPSGVGDIWTQPEPVPEPPQMEPTSEQGSSPSRPMQPRPDFRERPKYERRERSLVAPARLMIRLGRRDGIRPTDIVGAIVNESGIAPDQIGDIDIYDAFAFVDLPEPMLDMVLAALEKTTIRGQSPQPVKADPGRLVEMEGRGGDRGVRENRGGYPRSTPGGASRESRPPRSDLGAPRADRPMRDDRGSRDRQPERGERPVNPDRPAYREDRPYRDRGPRADRSGFGHSSRVSSFSKSGIRKGPSGGSKGPRPFERP